MTPIFKQTAGLVAISVLAAATAGASGFTNLYSFGAPASAGALPEGTLASSSGTLFGTTSSGSSGTVFAMSTTGADFTNLYVFGGANDGANPDAGVVLAGGVLYGTTSAAGSNGFGTVFKINTNGSGFNALYSFTATGGPGTNSDGAGPQSALLLSGGTLYGVAGGGGAGGNGTVFRINTDGSGFTNLHSFAPANYGQGTYTNGDGANPEAALVLSGDTLYGTAFSGGAGGDGTVFAINTNGTGFTNLYSFSALVSAATNSDGANPQGGLVFSAGTLYGTTVNGGRGGSGTVFAIDTNGTSFTNLYSFTKLRFSTNSDGANPEAVLVMSGASLYGTTSLGGTGGSGTVFKLNTNGTALTVLYTFTRPGGASNTNSDGAGPSAGLLLLGKTLYGTATLGGANGLGTAFALNSVVPIPLGLQVVDDTMVLTWNDPTFSLQSAPGLSGAFTNLPGASSPYTNTPAGSQRYFRLQSN